MAGFAAVITCLVVLPGQTRATPPGGVVGTPLIRGSFTDDVDVKFKLSSADRTRSGSCVGRAYPAGTAFLDSGDGRAHIANNESGVTTETSVVYFGFPKELHPGSTSQRRATATSNPDGANRRALRVPASGPGGSRRGRDPPRRAR
ncbi:hypothetical protein GCM10023168_09800 [Fodinibacter luteus]|uniref:Uncharacterized protein n=1 Tax=Fodinibacter luteus TaxID=552064 RepID=A0ABP8K528_9MICO